MSENYNEDEVELKNRNTNNNEGNEEYPSLYSSLKPSPKASSSKSSSGQKKKSTKKASRRRQEQLLLSKAIAVQFVRLVMVIGIFSMGTLMGFTFMEIYYEIDTAVNDNTEAIQSNVAQMTILNQQHQVLTSKFKQQETELKLAEETNRSHLGTDKHVMNLQKLKEELNKTRAELTTILADIQKAERSLAEKKRETEEKKKRANAKTQIRILAKVSSRFIDTTLEVAPSRVYLLSKLASLNITKYQHSCQTLGGKLAEIDHTTNQEDIVEYLGENPLPTPSAVNGNSRNRVYVGMTDEAEEGNWTYMSSERPIEWNAWSPLEYTGRRSHNCAFLRRARKYLRLIDSPCKGKFKSRYLCEMIV